MTETHHSLKNDRLAFRHDQNVVVDAGFARTCQQPGERFVQRLVTETECAVMHRHEFFCAQFQKGLHCFLWIHMHLTPAWRVVGANRQKRDLDVVAFADFLEAGEIGAVAAVKNRTTIRFDNKTAEAAMQISQKTGAPMMTRGQRNFERVERYCLPVIELVHNIKAEIVNEAANTHRHDDRLIGSDSSERSAIEMIKMRVCYQHQIDIRQMMQFDSRLFQPLDHLQPFRPVRIDQDIAIVGLNEKGGVPDPGDAKFTRPDFGKTRGCTLARPSGKKGRNEDLGQKIPPMPVDAWL